MSGHQVSDAAMTIIESMGLRRGLGQINSIVSRSAAKQPAASSVDPGRKTAASAMVVSGPINRFMYMEARNWAIDLVGSLRGSPVDVVIERLAGATTDRPGSYVAGIKSVIAELQRGTGHEQA